MKMLAGFAGTVRSLTHVVIALLGLGIVVSLLGGNVPFVSGIADNIVGLAHYRRMPSPLRGQDIGFLDDLFVDPKHRGQKIGEKLINKMKEISKSKGWNLVRWITRDDNVRAKSLYDRVSEKTNWEVYELK